MGELRLWRRSRQCWQQAIPTRRPSEVTRWNAVKLLTVKVDRLRKLFRTAARGFKFNLRRCSYVRPQLLGR